MPHSASLLRFACLAGASVAMSPLQLLKLAEGMILKQKKRTDVPWTYEETMLFIGVLQVSLCLLFRLQTLYDDTQDCSIDG